MTPALTTAHSAASTTTAPTVCSATMSTQVPHTLLRISTTTSTNIRDRCRLTQFTRDLWSQEMRARSRAAIKLMFATNSKKGSRVWAVGSMCSRKRLIRGRTRATQRTNKSTKFSPSNNLLSKREATREECVFAINKSSPN